MCVCYVVSNERTILEAPGELKRVEVEILVLKEYILFRRQPVLTLRWIKMGQLLCSMSC